MIEMLLGKASNVEYIGITEVDQAKEVLPTYQIKEPSVEEWNERARKQNTVMFARIFGRQPNDYDEVLSWIYAKVPEMQKSHFAGNE